jgi:hypothetical protein
VTLFKGLKLSDGGDGRRIQVFHKGEWVYVCGRSKATVQPIVTKDKSKAETGPDVLHYYQAMHPRLDFRFEPKGKKK